MDGPIRKHPWNAMEAQRYAGSETYTGAVELDLWVRTGQAAVGEDGQLDYASFGGKPEPSAVVVVSYECPSQWPMPGQRRLWRRTRETCQADAETPAYYLTGGMCEDCRLWRWWCWVEQQFGWDVYGELFGHKHPRLAEW